MFKRVPGKIKANKKAEPVKTEGGAAAIHNQVGLFYDKDADVTVLIARTVEGEVYSQVVEIQSFDDKARAKEFFEYLQTKVTAAKAWESNQSGTDL